MFSSTFITWLLLNVLNGKWVGRDISVNTATRYGQDGSGMELRWRRGLLHPSRRVKGVHPASYTMNIRSLPGVKRSGRGVDLQHQSSLLLVVRRHNSVWLLVRSTIAFHESPSNTLYFQLLIFTVCKSFLASSSHLFFGLPVGLEANGFYLKILVTSLSFDIISTWPNHFSLWDLINLIYFCCIRSSSSSLVSILHRPFNSQSNTHVK
jgi:hypothetical protein